VPPGLFDKLFDKLSTDDDKKPVKIKFKKPVPAVSEAGSWQNSKPSSKVKTSKGSVKAKDGTEVSLVTPVDPKIAATFPSNRPYEGSADMILCKHCRKPVFKAAAPAHIKECLKKKQEKQQRKKEAKEAKDAAARKERNGGVSPAPSIDANDGNRMGAKKSSKDADNDSVSKKTSKKRKADEESKGAAAKKKKKDEPKPKAAKPKGPVDVEKQCGVLLPNGSQCARSLTCKSHSMGAKRAVHGRSLPYDVLLANYQKKNQAKLQRMSFSRPLVVYPLCKANLLQALQWMPMHLSLTTLNNKGQLTRTRSAMPSWLESIGITTTTCTAAAV
jgi:SAGA-associated factor 73